MLIFKSKNSLIWLIVSVVLIAVLVVITILSTAVFYDLFNQIMPGGGERAVYAEGTEPRFISDYTSKEDALNKSNEFNVKLNEEGIVLLKNESGQLPIYTPESPANVKTSTKPKISIFGKNSANIAFGGSGSGGSNNTKGQIALHTALDNAGYETNPTLKSFYENASASGTVRPSSPPGTNLDDGKTVRIATYETPQSSYTSDVKNSYSQYNDAAIVVFTRMGGEGFDMGMSMEGMSGAREQDDHYLQLDQNETDLLAAVCGSFDDVIVVINSGAALELGFLEDEDHYAYNAKIKAALWIGFPGNSGLTALGNILNGTISPSGRLVDTYATNFKNDPTWANFGDNRVENGDRYRTYNSRKGEYEWQDYYFVDYEEGIYVGYKYYETRGYTDGETWYDNAVVYPFGYGKSYTDFSWSIDDKSTIDNVSISKDGKYSIKVKVTNNGSMAGKEVVQLYGHAPYINGGIEKPYVTLLDFNKTSTIEPSASDIVTLTFDPYYLASYDFNDKNSNGYKGYELEGGSGYKLILGYDAHNHFATEIPFSVPSGGIRYDKDTVTGDYDVVNRYTDQSSQYFNSDWQLSTVMSRGAWETTKPVSPSLDDRTVDSAFLAALDDKTHNNRIDFSDEAMPWYDEPMGVSIWDLLKDKDGNDVEYVDYDDYRWEDILDQCSIKEMINMVNYGAFKSEKMLSIAKPKTNESDGPAGLVNFMGDASTNAFYDTCYYASQVVVASTWNEKLVEQFGISVGNEGIIGNVRGDGMPYSGWYAPGVNIHRSPFGGRNFEYMSEDGLLSGKLAAAQIRGAQSRGVYCYIKHFALNEQETHRAMGGSASWVTEQAMRETFLRPFEIAVKEGKSRAIMSSFNRIGTRWTGGDYRLLTEILRNEWGFNGTVICDFNTAGYMDTKQMAYAGGDLNLCLTDKRWCDTSDNADVIILRQCVKNILYTVINSNVMEIVGYKMPYWTIFLIIIDCVAVVGLAVWGLFSIRSLIKREENQ